MFGNIVWKVLLQEQKDKKNIENQASDFSFSFHKAEATPNMPQVFGQNIYKVLL